MLRDALLPDIADEVVAYREANDHRRAAQWAEEASKRPRQPAPRRTPPADKVVPRRFGPQDQAETGLLRRFRTLCGPKSAPAHRLQSDEPGGAAIVVGVVEWSASGTRFAARTIGRLKVQSRHTAARSTCRPGMGKLVLDGSREARPVTSRKRSELNGHRLTTGKPGTSIMDLIGSEGGI